MRNATTLFASKQKVSKLKKLRNINSTRDLENALLEVDEGDFDPVMWVGNEPARITVKMDGRLYRRLQSEQARLMEKSEEYISLSSLFRRLILRALIVAGEEAKVSK